ncbi:hypothetical protein ABT381_08130 [Streptomyces sp. NPDC000151]|uniref:hypothetical protein n=1 Tax=Streptomyces sp. NPDC000151 TaxID=3154244 RepID=UPI0033208827
MTDETTGERPTEEAAPGRTRIDVRPYLPNREAAGALFTGSSALIARGWAWVTAEDWKEALARLGYVAGGGYVLAYLAHNHPSVVMPVGLVGWGVAAWMHTPSPTPATKRPAAAEDADQEHDEDLDDQAFSPAPDLELVAALVRKLAGTEHQGAHLDDLIATGELGDWEKADLKAALTAWEVPVEEGLKLRFNGQQRNRQGVRLRDLPAGLGEAPAEAGEGAPPTPAQNPAPVAAEHPPAAAA